MTEQSVDRLEMRLRRLLAYGPNRATNGSSQVWMSTSIGNVRKQNQDRVVCLVMRDRDNPSRDFRAAVLSDGMGGMAKGEVAATIAVSSFLARLLRTSRLPLSERLLSASHYANDSVFEELHSSGGATLSALIIDRNGNCCGINVGDSRIYGLAKNRELVQLSIDDTIAGHLGSKAGGGRVSTELVQFIGMEPGTIEPHLIEMPLARYDHALLTSDGLHGSEADTINKIAQRSQNLDRDFLSKLTSLSALLGGRDNASGILIRLEPDFGDEPIDGREIEVVTAYDRLNVWLIPYSGVAERPNLQQPGNTPDRSTERQSATISPSISGKKPQKNNRKNSKKTKKTKTDDLPLPLDTPSKPVLNIEFPDRDNKE